MVVAARYADYFLFQVKFCRFRNLSFGSTKPQLAFAAASPYVNVSVLCQKYEVKTEVILLSDSKKEVK